MKRSSAAFVFLLGVIVGLFAQRWAGKYWHSKPPEPETIANHLTRDLTLDQDQHDAVLKILTEEREKVVSLHESTNQELESLRHGMQGRIAALLKPEQKPIYDALVAKWEKRRKKMFGDMPNSPPPR